MVIILKHHFDLSLSEIIILMSQLPEQIPPHPLVTNKQVSIIRKTAVESLEPLIRKIEEHIEYLLTQTKYLRQQNAQLNSTIADHKVVHQRIDQFNETLLNIESKFKQHVTHTQLAQLSNKEQYCKLGIEIEKINRNLTRKQEKITELFEKNSATQDMFAELKREFGEFCENTFDRVDKTESSNRVLNSTLKMYRESSQQAIDSLTARLEDRESKYTSIDEKIELYLSERDETRKMILETLDKVDKTVNIDQYEKDWKIIRLENQNMRQDNQKMIDTALTPEIRKFLPEIIERLQQVRKVDRIEIQLNQQKQKTMKISQMHSKQLIDLQITIKQNYTELQCFKEKSQETLTNINNQLVEKINMDIAETQEKISNVENYLMSSILQKQSQLDKKVSEIVGKSRQQIYELVIEQIPNQQKQFYQKMKDFLPMLEATKKQIMERCDNITEFGQGLQAQLSSFNNKIVKIKSNMTVEFESINKKNRMIEKSINDIVDNNFVQLGVIISKYCQTMLESLSCQVQSFGGTHDVLVTYNDGIIYEKMPKSNDESKTSECNKKSHEINYRKLKTNTHSLTKSSLQMLIKLADQILCAEEFAFLKINKNKPSDHFKEVKAEIGFLNNEAILNNRKYVQSAQKKKRKDSLQNKLPSLDVSKTIDATKLPNQPERESYRDQLSQTLTAEYAPFKRKADRGNYRGRYSQLK